MHFTVLPSVADSTSVPANLVPANTQGDEQVTGLSFAVSNLVESSLVESSLELPFDRRYEYHQQLLAKIQRVYRAQSARREQKRLQHLIRHRRQMAVAEAAFRQDLAQAISPLTREGLGIQVLLNTQGLPCPEFVAEFEFYGQRWRLTRKRTWLGCQWTLWQAQSLNRVCRATSRQIESQLCYLLGRYCHATTHRLGVALLPAAAS